VLKIYVMARHTLKKQTYGRNILCFRHLHCGVPGDYGVQVSQFNSDLHQWYDTFVSTCNVYASDMVTGKMFQT
jgi:hypothetical protein